jgi:hypothetical protein
MCGCGMKAGGGFLQDMRMRPPLWPRKFLVAPCIGVYVSDIN